MPVFYYYNLFFMFTLHALSVIGLVQTTCDKSLRDTGIVKQFDYIITYMRLRHQQTK